jgi:hypothetical protein
VAISLHEKKNAETLAGLKQIVQILKLQIDDLAKLPEYADFVKSPEYSKWTTWYGRNKPDPKNAFR